MCIQFGLIAVGAVVYLNKICYQSDLTQVLSQSVYRPHESKIFYQGMWKSKQHVRGGININPNWKVASINQCVQFHEDPEYYGSISESQPAHSGRSRKMSKKTKA